MKQKQIFRWLLNLLWPFRWLIAGTVLLSASTVLANVGLLSVSAVLISMAALQPPLLDLMVYIVGVRFFGISRALLRYSERYVSHKVTFQILTALRTKIYNRIEPAAPAGLQQYSQGQLFDRLLNDIDILKYFYLRAVLAPAAAVVVLLVCSVVLAQFSLSAMSLLIALFMLFGLGVPLSMRSITAGKTGAAGRRKRAVAEPAGGLSGWAQRAKKYRMPAALLSKAERAFNVYGQSGVLAGCLR